MGALTPTFADQIKANGGVSPVPAPMLSIPISGPVESIEPSKELQPLKVALVGTAPSSRMLAPFSDESWKIWVCSPGNMNAVPRVDAWFEIHGNLLWPECKSYGEPYVEWLKKQPFPIYMQDQSLVPNALSFPVDEIVQEFGRDFFSSSFAWMLAFAMHKGAKEIALFGIDMASREEYILQRPGFFFFRHIAYMRGIKVWAPNESDIMQSPGLYGYSEMKPFGRKILARKQELKDRIAQMEQQQLPQLEQQVVQAKHNISYLKGALEDLDYMESIWIGQGG